MSLLPGHASHPLWEGEVQPLDEIRARPKQVAAAVLGHLSKLFGYPMSRCHGFVVRPRGCR